MSCAALATNIMGIHSMDRIRLPATMNGIRRLRVSLSLPQKICIRLLLMFVLDWNHPMSLADAPNVTAYAPMNGFTVPCPRELTTERVYSGLRAESCGLGFCRLSVCVTLACSV